MHTATAATHRVTSPEFLERLNSDHHELALRVFMVIVLAHWVEHLLQALQIYVLGWPVPEARGALGMVFWWMTALWIQFFHHIEHGILQTQAILGHNLLGRPVPTSLVQLWVPRVELHLFYNTIVFVPMVIAMYYHLFPPAAEKTVPRCSCALAA